MRLLLLTPEFAGFGGGIMTYYQQAVPALCQAGVEVTIIEGSAFNVAEELRTSVINGARHQRLEAARLKQWFSRFEHLEALPSFRKHLAAAFAMWDQAGHGERFDIVEAVDWGMLFVPAILDGRMPTVVQCHASIGQIAEHDAMEGEGAQDLMFQLFEKELISSATSVQTYSPANAAFWESRVGREVKMIAPAWSPNARSKRLSISSHGLVVGRLQRWKGPETLCSALTKMGSIAPTVEWVGRDTAWGSPKFTTAKYLRDSYPSVWSEKRVRLSKPVSPDEVASLQSAAKFNLVPSEWDVFNFTVAEAMSSGRPTIISRGAGASFLVEDGINGFVFDAGDADQLAGAIERVLTTTEKELANVSAAARETVLRELNPENVALKRIEAYRSTITAGRRSDEPRVAWIADAISQRNYSPGAFLEQYPLRQLCKHVAGRTRNKFANFFGGARS